MKDNLTIIQVEEAVTGNSVEHIIIDKGNGEFTSMPKSVYDEQQAAQAEHLNGIVDGKAKTK